MILSLKVKELNSKIEAKPCKGDVQVITWKIITVGEYLGPRTFRTNIRGISKQYLGLIWKISIGCSEDHLQ